METKLWNIDQGKEIYQEAAELLRSGETVAFPTETVYGLGADATNPDAVKQIYEAKGRPSDNPLIVHIADAKQMQEFIAEVPEKAEKLMEAFWPGPLTLILPIKPGVLAESVTAGLKTVGVRMPVHPVGLELLRITNRPIAAPSANRSGRPSPTTARHVEEDLSGRISAIIDGGSTGVGLESTVLDVTSDIPVILRPGGVSTEQIEEVIGEVRSARNIPKKEEVPKAPGMKYTHYAPLAPVYLVEGGAAFWDKQIKRGLDRGEKVGLLLSDELAAEIREPVMKIKIGSRAQMDEIARRLYDGLRLFDHTDTTLILAETFSKDGIGDAVMNRLEKAAGNKYLNETSELPR
ncbi:L-threonylcarbamoyladenylate synthase [Listeria aquatica]|uniref:L-threonylcarbamoyladenylate synthase n=1 Tax=Listeria aquatica TaxID=1494960 RepID=UPI003EF23727